jgi:ferredoxin--NADP+ reductase
MASLMTEKVTYVHHWNDTLFSFKVTRDMSFRFKNGHFTMIGLANGDRPLLRAYSVVSANYEEELEFFSIKVPNGPLTSRLQHLKVGDDVYINKKPTGTLTVDNLLPGKNLYLLSTGTGLAPFLSIIRDPEVYEAYDKIILIHGVRKVDDLAYFDFLTTQLPEHEYLGEEVREKLIYYPTVTREAFRNQGRLTDLIKSGKLFEDIGLPSMDPEHDRAMLCGSPTMLKECVEILEDFGLKETRQGNLGSYVVERAFVES